MFVSTQLDLFAWLFTVHGVTCLVVSKLPDTRVYGAKV